MRIAILEDDQDQADLLTAWLSDEGHHCAVFDDGSAFVRAYAKDSYDLLILDWMVPKVSGIEVLKHVRQRLDKVVPILIVTQRDSESDVVEALQNGADDYMAKPVGKAEMLARVNALARRVGFLDDTESEMYHYPPYKIDTRLREVSVNDTVVEMTQKEYELTLFLFKNSGRIVSRGHLLEVVWGTSATINTRTVDTHISRLRTKLNLTKDGQWRLTSVYQHGYRLENVVD